MDNRYFEYLFKGKIIKNKEIIDNVNFTFTIDKINPKRIKGIIKGTESTYNELHKFGDKIEGIDASFSIQGITEDNLIVRVQECFIKELKVRRIPGRKYEIEREIAELEAFDLKTERKYEKIPSGSLHLMTLFRINTRGILTLVSHRIGEKKPDGSIKIISTKNPNKINTKIGQLSFYKRYSYLPLTFNQRKGEYTYYSCVAEFEIKSINSKNYHNKIEEAKNVLEDYLYLISFISRKAVQWYQCTNLLYSKDSKGKRNYVADLEYFKKNTYPEEYFANRHECIIFAKDFDEFLNISFPEYIKNRDKLKSILGYYITSQEEKLMESSFLLFFIVLEALVNQFIGERAETKTMKKNQFKELSTRLKPIISEFCDEENIEEDLIINSLSELQRKPFLDKLESLIQRFNIFIDDLYPISKNKFKFYKIRNDLIHRGKVSDYDEFFKEKLKLQFLVERIILRILGWEREKFSTSDYLDYKFMS